MNSAAGAGKYVAVRVDVHVAAEQDCVDAVLSGEGRVG